VRCVGKGGGSTVDTLFHKTILVCL